MTKLEAWLEKAKKAPQSDSIHNKADIAVIEKLKAALEEKLKEDSKIEFPTPLPFSNYLALQALAIDPENL